MVVVLVLSCAEMVVLVLGDGGAVVVVLVLLGCGESVMHVSGVQQ